jgi:N-methylhydantoinase B
VEAWELDTGLAVRSMEFVVDSGGAGRQRGAPAVETVLELRAPMVATVCVEGVRHTARGSSGGRDGGAGHVEVEGDIESGAIADVAVERPVGPGVLRLQRGGGGGYGDPLERDAALVARDVVDGYVSPDAARSEYGVVVDDAGGLDAVATERLRAEAGR